MTNEELGALMRRCIEEGDRVHLSRYAGDDLHKPVYYASYGAQPLGHAEGFIARTFDEVLSQLAEHVEKQEGESNGNGTSNK